MASEWIAFRPKAETRDIVPFISVTNGTLRIPTATVATLYFEPDEYKAMDIVVRKLNGKQIYGLRFLPRKPKKDNEKELKRVCYQSGKLKAFTVCYRDALRQIFGEEKTLSTKTTRYRVEPDEMDTSVLIIREELKRGGSGSELQED